MTEHVDKHTQAEPAPPISADSNSGAPQRGSSEHEEVSLARVLARIGRSLTPTGIGTGPLAEIRRMTPGSPPPAFWRLYLEVVPTALREPAGSFSVRADRAWARLIRAMAEAAPTQPGRKPSFGAALATSGYSESRFIRLLRAEGDDLGREARVAARWLAVKGADADWWLVAQLLLDGTTPDAHRERAVHRLASDFFRAQASA